MKAKQLASDYLMTDAFNPTIQLDGEEYDFFCGCDYHNLQEEPRLREAIQQSLFRCPFKIGPSGYGFGDNPYERALEKITARFFKSETVITFPSGYMGNTILFRALSSFYDKIFVDEDSHYSMKDALLLSEKPFITFNHCDPQDLQQKMKNHLAPNERPMIASDGVFPVSGEIAPIPAYYEIIQTIPEALICIDDAHATGVLGKGGRGTYEHFGLEDPRLYYAGTMSKAFGSHGGIIPCSYEFAKNNEHTAYILKGSTPIPIPTMVASTIAMQILLDAPEKIQKLHENALYFKQGLIKLGFKIDHTPSAMACITLPSKTNVEELYNHLKKHHILTLYNPPGAYTSVPPNGGIKFTITSNHTSKQFDRILEVIYQWLDNLNNHE